MQTKSTQSKNRSTQISLHFSYITQIMQIRRSKCNHLFANDNAKRTFIKTENQIFNSSLYRNIRVTLSNLP